MQRLKISFFITIISYYLLTIIINFELIIGFLRYGYLDFMPKIVDAQSYNFFLASIDNVLPVLLISSFVLWIFGLYQISKGRAKTPIKHWLLLLLAYLPLLIHFISLPILRIVY